MISLATKHNDPEKTLGWSERIGYAAGGFGWNMINGIIGTYLTVYFTNVAFLDIAIISTLIAASKLFDGISDLIVGRMVDNTNSKLGKARPWLIRMCIPFAIATILLFFVPQSFPSAVKYIYVFIMYNLASTVCMTAMAVPFYSMISLMTRNPYERGFLGNIQQIGQTLGNVVLNTFFVAMLSIFSGHVDNEQYTQTGYTMTIGILCLIMVIVSFVAVISTRERVTEAEKAGRVEKSETKNEAESEENKVSSLVALKSLFSNKYWLMMFIAMLGVFFSIIFYSIGGVYYCMYILGSMNEMPWMTNAISLAQFGSMFVTPFFMKKFGKRYVYATGMGLLALGFLGFEVVGTSKIIMIICNVMKGTGLGMAGGMAMGLVADAITYGTLKTGVNAVGMGNAGVSAAQKIGLGLGQAIFGWILAASGFDATLDAQGIAQSETVVAAIRLLYDWIPMVMCALISVMMFLFFNLDKDLAKLRAEKGM